MENSWRCLQPHQVHHLDLSHATCPRSDRNALIITKAPSVFRVQAPKGYFPWVFSVGIFRGHFPWVFSRGYFSVGIFPWVFSRGYFPVGIFPWIFSRGYFSVGVFLRLFSPTHTTCFMLIYLLFYRCHLE